MMVKSMTIFRATVATVMKFAVAVLLANVSWTQAAIAAEFVSPPVIAPPHGYAIRAGFLATDNIDRIPFNERDEVIGLMELDGYTSYEGPRFTGYLQSTIGYRFYTLDTYEHEPRGTILGSGEWMILPRSLSWSASELLTNATIDPLENATPSNIQFINAFETGPRLTTRICPSQTLDIAALHTVVKAEDTLIDHTRQTALIDWQTSLSARNAIGLSLSGTTTEFDDDQLNTDFDRASAFITYIFNNDLSNVDLAAGMSLIKSATNDFEEEYETGRLQVFTQRTPQSSLYLSFSRDITDTAAALFEVARDQERLSPQVVIGQPYLGENANMQYTRGPDELQWTLSAGWSRIVFFEFEPLLTTGNILDQMQRRAGLSISTEMSSRFSATLGAQYSKVDYLNTTRLDDLREFTLAVEYQLDRRLSLLVNLSRFETISNDPAQTFTEHQALLALQYSMRGFR